MLRLWLVAQYQSSSVFTVNTRLETQWLITVTGKTIILINQNLSPPQCCELVTDDSDKYTKKITLNETFKKTLYFFNMPDLLY